MAQPVCYRHDTTEAVDSCTACLQPICSLCTTYRGMRILCPPCERKARRRSMVVKLTLVLLFLAGAGAGFWYVISREPPFDYGKLAGKVEKLRTQLEKEPCDRSKIIELGDTLYEAGDYRGVITRGDTFFKECGEYMRLRWITYEAHKSLSEYRQAVKVASMLIEDDPDDKDFWWWRGVAWEQLGEWEKAAADYRQAIGIQPKLSSIPFNLAAVLEKQKKPCEAIFPVEQYLHYYPEHRMDPKIQRQLRRFRETGNCDDLAGEGVAEIRFAPSNSSIRATAKVNDREGTFILDTGSTYLALSSAFAEKAGITLESMPEILVQTVTGIHSARLSVAPEVKLQGLISKRVPVVVVRGENMGPGVDGLLGLSFLSRYDVTMQRDQGKVRIESRR